MKAAVCYEPGKPLIVEDVTIDPPQQGEVRVRLSATAICHSDVHYIQGDWRAEFPMIAGHEAAGIVEEIGENVTLVQPGEHVVVSLLRSCGRCFYCLSGISQHCEGEFALLTERRLHTQRGEPIFQGVRVGAFAEYVVVDQSQVVQVPSDLPLDRAALLGCGVITGVGAVVNTAQVEAGSNVVVIGTGGVGLNTLQAAALVGARKIIAVDLVDMKLTASKVFGATHTINSTQTDVRQAVRDLTDGRGADYVFVTVGSTAAMEQGLRLVRRAGTLVIVGMPPAGAKLSLLAVTIADSSLKLLGSFMGSTRLRVDVPWLADLYQQGRLKLDELITARYPLTDINAAIESMLQGKALRNLIAWQ